MAIDNHVQQPGTASNSAQHSVSNVQQWLRLSQHLNRNMTGSHSAMAADPDPEQAQQRWQHAQNSAAHMDRSSPVDRDALLEQGQHVWDMQQAQHAQHHAHALETHYSQHAQHAQSAQHAQQAEVIQGLSQHLQVVQERITKLEHSLIAEQFTQQSMSHSQGADAHTQSDELQALKQIRDQARQSMPKFAVNVCARNLESRSACCSLYCVVVCIPVRKL